MNRAGLIDDIQSRYRQAAAALNERARRQWAAREAVKIGRGGLLVVSQALRMSPNTIKRGIQELEDARGTSPVEMPQRIRKPGGGRRAKNSPPTA
ncbi:MAG TPA: hypothetical protein VM510_11310 [Caulifigura sp.]|jgi:hypothetical protein|nr:hypothetical protein [Caulifigura sp.]